ncbi:hypothetical protein KKF34_07860 [Myxococcota bacterium]|nr:hypothetical protein [Myxococcota bacterium]MBU1382436.1 hypothetical protein [Myxococcota bacterium]MBU1496775.1 hypothetical protein [Myxococcota bacterium]
MKRYILLIIISILYTTSAYANPVDLFGGFSNTSGKGDTAAASCRNSQCLYYNPGGLALGKGLVFEGGLIFQVSSLDTPADSQSIRDPFMVGAGVAFPLPFRGFLQDRIRVGLFAVTPINEIAWVRSRLPQEVFYPYYENRSQRLMLIPGLSFKLFDSPTYGRIGLGIGLNYFAGLEGAIVGYEGATRSVEARVFEELEGRVAVNAGISYEISNWFFGLSYRQAFGVDFHNVSFNHVAGTDINIDLNALALYSPHTITWAGAYRTKTWGLELNILENLWSYYNTPYVKMRSVLPLVGFLAGELPDVPLKNTITVRLGGEFHSGDFTYRAGIGYEPSFSPVQKGISNVMDGDKYTFSLGASWAITKRVSIHAHLRYQVLAGITHRKSIITTDATCGEIPVKQDGSLVDELPCVADDPTTAGFQTTNPGYPSVTSGGGIFSGGISVEVRQ